MKIITHEDIIGLGVSPKEYYDWIVQSFKNKDKCLLPPKTSIIPEEHVFYNIMPSLNPENKIGGVKVVTRVPKRIPSLDSQIYLYDMNTGRLKAILDGNYITAMRTGAVAALAIETYAIQSYTTIAIMGLGVTASAIMNVLSYTTAGKQVTVKLLKYKNQEEEFIKKYKDYPQFNFVVCDNYKELIVESDVIISCVTYADKDYAEFEWFKEGALLLPVHVKGFENIDYLFDRVHVDDPEHLHHMKNFNRFQNFAQISDVLNGKAQGRQNDAERIVSYNIGLSIHDIQCANEIYKRLENELSLDIDLMSPKEKYWL